MLHSTICHELVRQEAAVARARLSNRFDELLVEGAIVTCRFGSYRMRLDGTYYNAEPFRLSFVDENAAPLPGSSWPPGMHSGQHPLLNVPWCCVQGTYEYHTYYSHAVEVWDKQRDAIRLTDLLDHLLRRSGR